MLRYALFGGLTLVVLTGCPRDADVSGKASADSSAAAVPSAPAPENSDDTAEDEKPQELWGKSLAELAASLPPPPPELRTEVPRVYPDGAWSVLGLRQDITTNEDDGAKGKKVMLRAFVTKVYDSGCPPGEVCPSEPMHVWVADRADETNEHRWMRVTGLDEVELPGALRIGERYTMQGIFSRVSNDGEHVDLLGLFILYALVETDGDPASSSKELGSRGRRRASVAR